MRVCKLEARGVLDARRPTEAVYKKVAHNLICLRFSAHFHNRINEVLRQSDQSGRLALRAPHARMFLSHRAQVVVTLLVTNRPSSENPTELLLLWM
jgi:hypothetical protein